MSSAMVFSMAVSSKGGFQYFLRTTLRPAATLCKYNELCLILFLVINWTEFISSPAHPAAPLGDRGRDGSASPFRSPSRGRVLRCGPRPRSRSMRSTVTDRLFACLSVSANCRMASAIVSLDGILCSTIRSTTRTATLPVMFGRRPAGFGSILASASATSSSRPSDIRHTSGLRDSRAGSPSARGQRRAP